MSKYILIVEDEDEIRNLVIDLLSQKVDHDFLEASDPLEALEVFHHYKNDISLVVCDYYMPNYNGNEFCKIIKQDRPYTKIVMFTGNTSIDKERPHQYNVDQIVFKSGNWNDLLKSI